MWFRHTIQNSVYCYIRKKNIITDWRQLHQRKSGFGVENVGPPFVRPWVQSPILENKIKIYNELQSSWTKNEIVWNSLIILIDWNASNMSKKKIHHYFELANKGKGLIDWLADSFCCNKIRRWYLFTIWFS